MTDEELNRALMLERLRDMIVVFLSRGELESYEYEDLHMVRNNIDEMLKTFGDFLNTGSSPSYNTLKAILHFIDDEISKRNKQMLDKIDITKINSDINKAFEEFIQKRKVK